jgi:hypothetical protein
VSTKSSNARSTPLDPRYSKQNGKDMEFFKIDISMQYYTFELEDESAGLCTTVTP